MADYRVGPADAPELRQWDRFVDGAVNGTLFQTWALWQRSRQDLEALFLVVRKDGGVVAQLPALYEGSSGTMTLGGLVMAHPPAYAEAKAVAHALCRFLLEGAVLRAHLLLPPAYVSAQSLDTLTFALLETGTFHSGERSLVRAVRLRPDCGPAIAEHGHGEPVGRTGDSAPPPLNETADALLGPDHPGRSVTHTVEQDGAVAVRLRAVLLNSRVASLVGLESEIGRPTADHIRRGLAGLSSALAGSGVEWLDDGIAAVAHTRTARHEAWRDWADRAGSVLLDASCFSRETLWWGGRAFCPAAARQP